MAARWYSRLAAHLLATAPFENFRVPAARTNASVGSADLGEAGPLSRGVQAGRKALRIRHVNGMEVRKKRPRAFKRAP